MILLWYPHDSFTVPRFVCLQKLHMILFMFLSWFFTVLVCPDIELILFTKEQIRNLIDEKLVGLEWESVLKVDKLPDKPPAGAPGAKPPASDPVKDVTKEKEPKD